MELLSAITLLYFTAHVKSSDPVYNPGNSPRHTETVQYSSAFEEAKTMYDDYESQALFIYKLFCRQSCQEDVEMMPNRFCYRCYCDSACSYYGDCCPDYKDQDRSNIVDYICDSMRVPRHGMLVPFVHRCPPDYLHKEIVDKCQSVNEEDWRSLQPVSDPQTLVSYRNRYCAQCHAVGSNGVKWVAGAKCSGAPPRFQEDVNKDDVYRTVVETDGCSVIFIPPYNESYRECDHRELHPRICNATSLWNIYDPLVERGCLTFPKSPTLNHTNIFCYICNTDMSWKEIKYHIMGYEPNVFRETLSALLDLNDESDNAIECDFTDPYKCTCRNVSCSEGKIYESGQCESVYEVSNNNRYSFCINGTLVFNSSIVSSSDFDDIHTSFRDFLNTINAVVDEGIMEQRYISACNEIMVASFTLSSTVFFRNPIRTGDFESQILSIEQNGLKLTQEYIDMTFNIIDICERNESVSLMSRHCPEYSFPTHVFTDRKFNVHEMNLLRGMGTLYFSRILSCPRIFLLDDEVIKTSETSITIYANNKSLRAGDFTFKHSGYFVCLQDYLFSQDLEKTSLHCESLSPAQTPKFTTLGILSGVCTCFSVVFLLITTAIFSSFKSLRTTIGLSIMALSLSLVLAQMLFEFGAEQTEIPWVCQLIGILTHFFWLSSTFWMNVCTMILFYKLNFPMKSRLTSTKAIIIQSLLYTSFGSILIISITILASYLHDGTTGYGGSSCYISTYNGRRYGFALPVGLLVLKNIILFSYTFIKVKTEQKPQSTNENQISMLGCLKLSVITGLTWIFAFLYEATGNVIFAYMFTLCGGLQGIAIFLAFVANKKVFRLIKNRFGLYHNSGSRNSFSKNDCKGEESSSAPKTTIKSPVSDDTQKVHCERRDKM